jgi:hypothetical protein
MSSSFRTSGSAATKTGASEHGGESTQRNELRINRAQKRQNAGEYKLNTGETELRRSRAWTDCRGK